MQAWFRQHFSQPTAAQQLAWPRIARGEHVLVTAPTGTGKTLTAFLCALDRFVAGEFAPGRTRVLYLSPLKALNNDIARNLLTPLGDLKAARVLPDIRAETRSGDTSQAARQRLLRQPPEILITTPESLLLMLSGIRGRLALQGIETVIIDEAHALVDDRRGTLLSVALERLVELTGEFQRIALSATVRPADRVAAFLAGHDAQGRARRMTVVATPGDKRIELVVRHPATTDAASSQSWQEAATTAEADDDKAPNDIWTPLARAFRAHIDRNRTTLLFVNSRRLAERLTFRINDGAASPRAFAHHGSLARELRLAVEQRLKAGSLAAIVATSSLELGIDIGALDEVVLVQSPPDVASTLQRIGRAGHSVGATSRATLYPTHAQDLVTAAALVEAVTERDLEEIRPLTNPLDVLAQLLVALTANETWPIDALYALVRRSGAYCTLAREHFDAVLDMLGGRYAGSRIRELRPRLRIDPIRGTAVAERSAVMTFHHSGGVIPDRGYFRLRHAGSGTIVGELDEEFVWEARPGQIFTLATQNWQIERITHDDVLAHPTQRAASAPPFWRSEEGSRSHRLSRRIARFLAIAEHDLARGDRAALAARLRDHHHFDAGATEWLIDHLERQRASTRAPLPHAGHLLIETVAAAPGGYRTPGELHQTILHTGWGATVNRPFALALAAALQPGLEEPVETMATDDAIVLVARQPLEPERVLQAVSAETLSGLLRQSLEGSGFFGARFREAAGRALLLSRQRFNTRLPLWISRLQAKKLMSAVRDQPDFPLMLECWRTCLDDEFDLPALEQCLRELACGDIRWTAVSTTTPSPFAAALAWGQINRYMYADDQPELAGASALTDDLIGSLVETPALRPRLHPATIDEFVARRQRRIEGYVPEDADAWAEWIRERVLLPANEYPGPATHADVVRLELGARAWWTHRALLHGLHQSGLCAGTTVVAFTHPGADQADAADAASAIRQDIAVAAIAPLREEPRTAHQFACEILSFHGPLETSEIVALLPHVPADLLSPSPDLLHGQFLAADPDAWQWCDRQNYEALLRLQRARARPRVSALPATALPGFLADWQGLGQPDQDLTDRIERLSGWRAPVETWLSDLPAARMNHDSRGIGPDPGEALQASSTTLGFRWQGAGTGQIRIGDPTDLDLLTEPHAASALGALFRDRQARYTFADLRDRQAESLDTFNTRWWEAVWSGDIVADDLNALRTGLARRFQLMGNDPSSTAVGSSSSRSRRRGFRPTLHRPPRYRQAGPVDWPGWWQWLDAPAPVDDPLDALEDARESARLLLDRYGFLCRELVNREGPPLRWRALFRSLRLMELAGEVVAGHWFEGLSGPQFVLPAALSHLLARGAGGHAATTAPVFWVSAMDPVAPCGLGLDWPSLPARRPGNYLSFVGGRLALVVEREGQRLIFLDPPVGDAGTMAALLGPLRHLLQRKRRLAIATIDGQPAADSPLLSQLATTGRITRDHRQIWLEQH